MEVKILWAAPDPEYQIVRAIRDLAGEHDKIDSIFAPMGLKRAKTGGLEIEYPVMRVVLGENDVEVLKDFMKEHKSFYDSALIAATAVFMISDISPEVLNKLLSLCGGISEPVSKGKKQKICVSNTFEAWTTLLKFDIWEDGGEQLDMFESDEYREVLRKIGRELYKVAPVVFESYR